MDVFLDSEEFFSAIKADEMFNKANRRLVLDAAMIISQRRLTNLIISKGGKVCQKVFFSQDLIQ